MREQRVQSPKQAEGRSLPCDTAQLPMSVTSIVLKSSAYDVKCDVAACASRHKQQHGVAVTNNPPPPPHSGTTTPLPHTTAAIAVGRAHESPRALGALNELNA